MPGCAGVSVADALIAPATAAAVQHPFPVAISEGLAPEARGAAGADGRGPCAGERDAGLQRGGRQRRGGRRAVHCRTSARAAGQRSGASGRAALPQALSTRLTSAGPSPKPSYRVVFLTGGEGLRETYRAGPVARALGGLLCARKCAGQDKASPPAASRQTPPGQVAGPIAAPGRAPATIDARRLEDWPEEEASEAEKDGFGCQRTVFPGNCF